MEPEPESISELQSKFDVARRDVEGWNAEATLCLNAADADADDYERFGWMRDLTVRVGSGGLDGIDPDLFTRVVGRLSELFVKVGGVDAELDGLVRLLDKVVVVAGQTGVDIVALLLVKASLLFGLPQRAAERERVLGDAITLAEPMSTEWMKASLLLAFAYVDASKYRKARRYLDGLDAAVERAGLRREYGGGISAHRGILLVTVFREPRTAASFLDEAIDCADDYRTSTDKLRWIASAAHYRGRLHEMSSAYPAALSSYHHGEALRAACDDDPVAEGFYHLRVGELLVGTGGLRQAAVHLRRARSLFDSVAHQGSGFVQAELAFAGLTIKRGDLDSVMEANDTAESVLRICRARDFHRGELLALAFLARNGLRMRRPWQVARAMAAMLVTLLGRELARNNPAHLVRSLPSIARVLAVRGGGLPGSAGRGSPVICECALHA